MSKFCNAGDCGSSINFATVTAAQCCGCCPITNCEDGEKCEEADNYQNCPHNTDTPETD